jgi:hypothetical protein
MNPLWLDLAQKLFASFAFLVGGFWVLMNYIRNRTHVPRLQVELRVEFVQRGGRHFLLATCQVKNAGQSIIRLQEPEADGIGPRGTALLVRVLPRLEAVPPMIEAPWEAEIAVFGIFTNHRAIEPGLVISEQKLIYQPDSRYDACWVQLRVSAHGQRWSAIAVAVRGESVDEPVSQPQGTQTYASGPIPPFARIAPAVLVADSRHDAKAGAGRRGRDPKS